VTAYEILLLLDPDTEEDRQNEILSRMRALIERQGGRWERQDVWGRRKLAYEIDHKADGIYHLVLFESDPETLEELSRVLRITDGVMRHLAVRRPAAAAPSAPRVAPAEEHEPAEAEPVAAEEPVQEPL
jgi:small subunit ribosomal protein S6